MNEQVQEIRYLVGEAWKGTYDAATPYGNANVVQDPTGLSVYRSLKPGNVGHPLTDANWWFCIIDLSSIKAESDRIADLNQAIAQDEALRVAAERSRQQKEAEREAAETQRNEAEQARINAEQQRVTNETQRETKEQQRISAEQRRVNAESNRVTAEQSRVHAETLRDNAEDARAVAETNRAAAEQQRITNEQERIAQEQSRVSAEQQRVSDFNTMMQNDQQAFNEAQTARQTAYQAAEGTESGSVAGDGSRWGAFKTNEAARDAKVDAKVADITNLQDLVAFINKSFGKYNGEREITLQQAKADKYVNVNGGETSASGYGISTPVSLNAGDILLVPSTQAVPADVSVIARLVDRTYQKVIAYIYTYRTDYPELPATATADYDSTLVYTAVYDESGDTPVLTGWTRDGQTYTTLPATREVNEQFYEPLMKQAVSAMPSTGYYIYLCPTAMTVVVSGLTATVDGGTALVVGWGIFKNITTNFVGAPGQSVLAQAFAVLFAAIDGMKAQLENLGETKAVSIDFENSPKLCGQDMFLTGDGAPASPNVPTMVGQEYLDVTNKKCYKAFSVTGAISDWVLLN
jgi:hypothetical protein